MEDQTKPAEQTQGAPAVGEQGVAGTTTVNSDTAQGAATQVVDQRPRGRGPVKPAEQSQGAPAVGEQGGATEPVVEEPEVKRSFEDLSDNATIIYEHDEPSTEVNDGETEVTTIRTKKSMTKAGWNLLPVTEKGSNKGNPAHLKNAKLIGYWDGKKVINF